MKRRTGSKVCRGARVLLRKARTAAGWLTPASRRRARQKKERRAATKQVLTTTAQLAATEAFLYLRKRRAANSGKHTGKVEAPAPDK